MHRRLAMHPIPDGGDEAGCVDVVADDEDAELVTTESGDERAARAASANTERRP